uniref:Rabenosyn Rab binding domain-containing protein n=1 Tax=Anguilla anguilla TaxID=7936 RepID=A0A0E9U3J2_ANGAN
MRRMKGTLSARPLIPRCEPSNQGSLPTPFEEDNEPDIIEEELLLQQIDNIRAYIFDAKLNGRTDEVELLSENLRDLQRTLQEQRSKTQ